MNATETYQPPEWIDRATVAGMIRRDLKRAFPAIKFSVRSRSYAGGGAIDVYWTDGPTRDRVATVCAKYQDRGFDGSIDLEYHIDHYMLPDGTIGQLKSSGTQGSLGYVPAFNNGLPAGAKRVRLNTGYLDFNREFSPAMQSRCDALVPSNLTGYERERWLWRVMNETEA